MDVLLVDLTHRYKCKVSLPFAIGHDMLVVDLLAPRSTDVYPTTRLVVVDPAGKGKIKISTCYPDPKGECYRPVGDPKKWDFKSLERLRHIKAEYEVSPALVETLKRDGILITGKRLKLKPNEYILDFEWYRRLLKVHGNIEYRAAL